MDARFQALAEAAAARWEVPALAVGVLVDGRSSELAVGCAPETRFRVASVTKPFTATLALALIDPDEPAGVWAGDVRISHLLAHTSGYACECGDLARFGVGDDALGDRSRGTAVGAAPRRPRGSVVVRQHRLLARRASRSRASQSPLRGRACPARARAGGSRGDRVRRAGRRGQRTGLGRGAVSAGAPALRRSRLERARPARVRPVPPRRRGRGRDAGPAWQADRRRLRARPVRRARRRDRGVGPSGLLRRVPVELPRRARPGCGVRRPDLERSRRAGPPRARGCVVRGGARGEASPAARRSSSTRRCSPATPGPTGSTRPRPWSLLRTAGSSSTSPTPASSNA